MNVLDCVQFWRRSNYWILRYHRLYAEGYGGDIVLVSKSMFVIIRILTSN